LIKSDKELINYNFYESAQYLNKFFETCNNISDSLFFKAYTQLFYCQYRINDTSNTEKTYKIIESFVSKNPLYYKNPNYLITKAYFKEKKQQFDEAINAARKILAFNIADTSYIMVYYKIGAWYEQMTKKDSAFFYYNQAYKLLNYKKNKAFFESSIIYSIYGFCNYFFNNSLTEAKKYFDSSLYVVKHSSKIDWDYYAWNYYNYGVFLHYQGLIKEALEYYNKAYEIYQNLKGNYDTEKMILMTAQANAEAYLNRFTNAENKIDFAISYFHKNNDNIQLFYAYYSKFYVKYLNRNFIEALNTVKYLQKISDLLKINYKFSFYKAICYNSLKNKDSAEYYFNLALQTNNNDINIANVYGEYARFLIENNKYKKALLLIDNLLEANPYLKERSQVISYLLYWKALALERTGRLNESLAVYDQVIKNSLVREINYTSSILPYIRIDEILSHDNLIDGMVGKGNALLKLAENSNNKSDIIKNSLAHYEKAAEIFNMQIKTIQTESDKLMYNELKTNIYENIFRCSVQLYYLSKNIDDKNKYLLKALNACDNSKMNVLTQLMQENLLKKSLSVPDSIVNYEHLLAQEVNVLNKLIKDEYANPRPNKNAINNWQLLLVKKMTQIDELENKCETLIPEYKRQKYEMLQLTSFERIYNSIPKGSTVIEYMILKDSLYAFIIEKDKICLKSVPTDSIENMVFTFRNKLCDNIDKEFSSKSFKDYIFITNAIYNKLIQSFKNYISYNEILIIPDKFLSYIPFDALVTDTFVPAQVDYGLLPFTLHRYTFSYAYSFKLSALQNEKTAPICKGVIAFAPKYGNNINEAFKRSADIYEKLLPISGAVDEAKTVTKTVGGRKFIGKKADKNEFKKHMRDSKILHLAMHTIIDDSNPQYSKLAFSPRKDSTNDGLMNVYELYNYHMLTPLVVLSACNTGYGKLMQGEGLYSLSRGFIYADCPALVMTLWSIADKSSSRLMHYFYSQLRNENNINFSLRVAKRYYIQNSDSRMSHPYYWAGYIASGKRDPIKFIGEYHKNLQYFFIFLFAALIFVILYLDKRGKI